MDDGCGCLILLVVLALAVVLSAVASLVAVGALVLGAVVGIFWLVAWLGYIINQRSAENSNPSPLQDRRD